MQKLNMRMQKLNLRMQKLNFPGTHWRGLALIGAQKKPLQPITQPSADKNFNICRNWGIGVFSILLLLNADVQE